MNIIKAIPNKTIKDRYTFFKGTTYEFHTYNNSKYIFYNGRSTKFTDLSDFTITSVTISYG